VELHQATGPCHVCDTAPFHVCCPGVSLLPEVAVGSLGVGGVDFVDHFVHVDVLAACAALPELLASYTAFS